MKDDRVLISCQDMSSDNSDMAFQPLHAEKNTEAVIADGKMREE